MSLSIRDLQVKIGNKTIIDDVELEVDSGKLVALLGVNGAGKTTLIKAIAGIIPYTKGHMTIGGSDLARLQTKERAKLVAYVPQHLSTTIDYSVEDFILMGITPYLGFFSSPQKVHYQMIEEALKSLEMEHLKGKTLMQLSGGQKQMIYLVRAIVQQAQVMILDEPTAYLDFKRQHRFLERLVRFVKTNNKAALFSVHDPNLALKYADEIAIVYQNTVMTTLKKKHGIWEEDLEKDLMKLYGNNIKLIKDDDNILLTYKE